MLERTIAASERLTMLGLGVSCGVTNAKWRGAFPRADNIGDLHDHPFGITARSGAHVLQSRSKCPRQPCKGGDEIQIVCPTTGQAINGRCRPRQIGNTLREERGCSIMKRVGSQYSTAGLN